MAKPLIVEGISKLNGSLMGIKLEQVKIKSRVFPDAGGCSAKCM
jgi:hypothetical protein